MQAIDKIPSSSPSPSPLPPLPSTTYHLPLPSTTNTTNAVKVSPSYETGHSSAHTKVAHTKVAVTDSGHSLYGRIGGWGLAKGRGDDETKEALIDAGSMDMKEG